MKTKSRQMSANDQITLLLGVSLTLGFFVRFLPGLQAGFPINDGGMFLSMIQDLGAPAAYRLPEFTTYNSLNIPYTYPPLGFYLGRILGDILPISDLDVLRWFPPVVHTISIVVFYRLATDLLNSKLHGALAAAVYALTPGAYGWFVMGGGLTRSLGALFLLLTVFNVFRLFQQGGRRYFVLGTMFCGLTILSHPEAGIHAAASCILLWFFFGHDLQTFGKIVLVGAGAGLLAMPWWWTAFSYHGLAPFVSALQTGMHGQPFWVGIYNAIFTSGTTIPVLAVLRLLGLGWGVWKKHYFLVMWVVVPYLVEPRSAPSVAFYPLTLLSVLTFMEALPQILYLIRKDKSATVQIDNGGVLMKFQFILLIYLFVESGLYGYRLVGNSLKPADINAMEWIRINTVEGTSFLPLTGIPNPEIDPFVEWFPVLTERRSQSTIQGHEWLLGSGFYERYAGLSQLQQCAMVFCVEKWSVSMGLDYDYVVVRGGRVAEGLLEDFEHTEAYERVYSVDGIHVFRFSP